MFNFIQLTAESWNWGEKGGGIEKGEKEAVRRKTGYKT